MANYFTLTRMGESSPSLFTRIDEELCRHLGMAVHETQWANHWYDWIGLGISMGMSPEKIISLTDPDDERGFAMIEYLRTYYEWDAWYQAGR